MKSQVFEGDRPALYRLEIFGHFRLRDRGATAPHFYSDKVRALLVSLVVESPGRLSRERLIERLWPRYRRTSALTSLRKALHELRRSLPKLTILQANRREIWLEQRGHELSCDWWEAKALFHTVLSHDHAHIDGCGCCLGGVKALRELLSEEVCPELDVDEPEGFDQWRAGLRSGFLSEVEALVQQDRTRYAYASLGNIPISEEQLQGRGAYLQDLMERIGTRAERLIALVGMGGIGKSHLARALARRCAGDFPDGIWLLPLEAYLPKGRGGGPPTQELGWLARYVARMMGLNPEKGGMGVLERLRSHACLIVIDEFEWVLEGGAGQTVGLDGLKVLVDGMPRSQFIVTSRRSLGPLGSEVRVSGLPQPPEGRGEVEGLSRTPSVALFLGVRGRRLDLPPLEGRELEDIAHLCRCLGGHPLGIKLAGALAQSMPLPEVVHRVDDDATALTSPLRGGLPRHRALDGLIGDALTSISPERALLLTALSLWRGPIFPKDVAPVLGEGSDIGDVEDALRALEDVCLLEPGNGRRFHALVREAVVKRIPLWAEAFHWDVRWIETLRLRRRAHFLGGFPRAYAALVQGDRGVRQRLWFTLEDSFQCWDEALSGGAYHLLVEAAPGLILVSHEHGRLRDTLGRLQALDSALEGAGQGALRGKVCVWIGVTLGHLGRSQEALGILLPLATEGLSPRERSWRAVIAGSHHLYTGSHDAGFALLETCIAHPDPKGLLEAETMVFALSLLGMWRARTGREGGEETLRAGLALSQRFGIVRFQAQIHTNLGGVHSVRGETEEALTHLIQARALADSADLKSVQSSILQALGYVYLDYGENGKALEAYESALRLGSLLALPIVIIRSLQGCAHALYSMDRLVEALERAEHGLSLCDEGTNPLIVARLHLMVGIFRCDLGEPRALEAADLAFSMSEEAKFWPTQCGADALRLTWALKQGDRRRVEAGTQRMLGWMDSHPGLPVPSGLDWAFTCYQGLAFLGDGRREAHLEAIRARLKGQLLRLSSRAKRRKLATGSPVVRRIINTLRVNVGGEIDGHLGLE